MRLPMAGEYAVRCVLFLCAQDPGEVVPRKGVAGAMRIPEQFLAKIAQQLSKAGIIEILQGARGGYRLLRSPDKVSLLEVVEAVTGEIFLNDCIVKPGCCSRTPQCSVHQVWARARTQLRQTLGEAAFSWLLGQESCLSPATSVPSARREGSRTSRSR